MEIDGLQYIITIMQEEMSGTNSTRNLSRNRFVNLLFVNAELKETTFKKTIALYVCMALVFLSLSIMLFVVLNSVQEYKVVYYSPLHPDKCPPAPATCDADITIQQPMLGDVYLMYEVGNFYQNHRRYLQSKSNYQLAGNQITDEGDAAVCQPYVTNHQMGQTLSWAGTQLDPDAIASPCGAIAKTFFNDTYVLKTGTGEAVTILENGISWPGDKGYKYKEGPNSSQNQWINPEDEHFIVWMRTSGLPNFRKLWGRIEGGLEAGTYRLQATNNYDSNSWEGERAIVLSTNSVFGGKNLVMPIAFLFLGLGCIVASIFFIRKWKSDKLPLSETHGD